MTATAIILYGSRARGDVRQGADIDLIAAEPAGELAKPRDVYGVSLHFYPQPWLMTEAEAGNLFVYHVAFEGIALLDVDSFFARLKNAFCLRASYLDEIRVADRIARAVLSNDWGFDTLLRRRYFWAIRTIIIGRTADIGKPIFGAAELERFSGIEGLARHIDHRSTESFSDCERFGRLVLDRLGTPAPDLDFKALLKWLGESSSIGRDTVRLIETKDAIEAEGLRFYL